MKLIKLTIANIGPYKGEHIIDFNMLNNSLFLITGPTGSGKSYIFDAICYAVYGRTSGDNREINDLKSKYASIKDLAYVILEFEYHNKKYIIRREPKQLKQNQKKTDGEYKVKEVNASAILTMPNGDVIAKNVDKKMEEIIGLSYDQFKMTMMIAQGDFYSLINADTKEREEIFRKILNTEKLNEFSDKLASAFKEQNDEINKIEGSISTARASFNFGDELDDKIKNDVEILSSIIPLIANRLEADKNKLDELNGIAENNNKLLMKEKLNLNNARINNDNVNSYKEALKGYEELLAQKDNFNELDFKINKAKEASKIIDANKKCNDLKLKAQKYLKLAEILFEDKNNLAKILVQKQNDCCKIPNINADNKKISEEIANLKKDINELDNFNENITKYEDLIKVKNGLNEDIEKLNKQYSNNKLAIEEINKKLGVSYDEEINNCNLEIQRIKNEKNKILEYKDSVSSYINKTKEYITSINDVEKLGRKVNEAKNDCLEYETKYHKSIAGILAKDLLDNKPCPVCGSIHHPNKAILVEEISKAKLDELKNKEKIAIDNYNKANLKLQQISTETTSLKTSLDKILSDYNIDNIASLYQDSIKKFDNLSAPLEEKLNSLNECKMEQSRQKVKADELAIENEKILEKISTKQNALVKNEGDASRIDGEIKANEHLKGKDKNLLLKREQSLQNEYEENNKNIERLNKELGEAMAKVSENEASIKGNSKLINENEIELDEASKELNNLFASSSINNLEEATRFYLDEMKLKELDSRTSKYKIDISVKESLIDQYKNKGYDKLQILNLDKIQNKVNNLEKELNDSNKVCQEFNSKYALNENAYKTLLRLQSENEQKLIEYNEVKDLYEVAAGKINGRKISFEVYYQLQIFDEILKVASFKFNRMSNGRYELLPGKPKGGNGQIGLEIDVLDLYNGQRRPVSGLSGGESFQASMALALAFSEIIEIKAGGVELNSMFIDEGFGTLDSEMLDNTKKILLDVGKQTNRRIGIISHIAELERSISSKIVVSKSDKGSSFKIINE